MNYDNSKEFFRKYDLTSYLLGEHLPQEIDLLLSTLIKRTTNDKYAERVKCEQLLFSGHFVETVG